MTPFFPDDTTFEYLLQSEEMVHEGAGERERGSVSRTAFLHPLSWLSALTLFGGWSCLQWRLDLSAGGTNSIMPNVEFETAAALPLVDPTRLS